MTQPSTAADSCPTVHYKVNIVTWHGFPQLQTGARGTSMATGRRSGGLLTKDAFKVKILDKMTTLTRLRENNVKLDIKLRYESLK